MIRVTVELISAIHPSRSRVLGVATIANDGTGTNSKGNYVMELLDSKGSPYKRTSIYKYPRNAVGMWNLVAFGLVNLLKRVKVDTFRRF